MGYYWILLRLGVFKPFFPSKNPATRNKTRKKARGRKKGFPIFCCLSTLTLSVDCYAKNTKNTLECARSKPKADDSSWTLLILKLSLFFKAFISV